MLEPYRTLETSRHYGAAAAGSLADPFSRFWEAWRSAAEGEPGVT